MGESILETSEELEKKKIAKEQKLDRSLRDLIEIIHFTEKVSTKIHGILDEAAIYNAVKEESIKSKKYTLSIVLLTEDGSGLRIAESTIPQQKLKAAEKAAGLRLKEYSIDLKKSTFYRRAVREGKTVQAPVNEIVNELFPRPLAYIISKMLNYEKKSSILTPLRRHNQIIGAVAMKSTELAEYLIPSVKSLAQHISTALELADEYAGRTKMEKALQESEKRYRLLAENATDVIWTTDMELKFTYVSPFVSQLLGYSAEEAIDKSIKDVLTSTSYEAAIKVFEEELTKEKKKQKDLSRSSVIELELICKNGSTVWVESKMTFLRNDRQEPVEILGVVRDISERKEAERQLRESEEKFRGIAERNFDGIYEMDTEGRITYASPALERITGYTPDELLGNLFMDYAPESVLTKGFQALSRVLQGVTIQGMEIEMIRKDGTTSLLEINVSPVFKDDRVIGVQGVIRDITERKKTEEELERYRHHLEELVQERTTALTGANEKLQQEISERRLMEESLAAEKERLAVTLRSIGDGVITTDTEGTVVLINKVAESLTGWTQEEAVGKPLDEVFHIVNEHTRIRCESPVDKVLSHGVVVGLGNNTMLIARDGTERIIADSGAPIRDRMSRVIGVVLVFRDITEKRKMEQELLRTQKLESLGNLAGGIAHDFNNILTAILSNTNLAKIYAADNKVAEKLTKIEKASLQAKELTQQLLTFSKGGAPIKKATSITELIRDSASFALRGSNVRCHFYIPDDLWSADIDEGQISQVINNIIMNADEAMPEGGVIQVRAENVVLEDSDTPPLEGRYVKISITDQGVGIPEKYVQKIFDPYFTTKQKGSGLGLSTSYSIIRKHDGYIDVDSEVGVGTTFYIYLPASQERGESEVKRREVLGGQGTILLMDDEEIVRDAAGEVLQYLGYTVTPACDGEEALTLYTKALEQGTPFDVVIMDLTIPGGMGGKEAIEDLLTIDPDAKAIVASGYSTDPVMADYRNYGFKGVVTKPYSMEDLSEVLHTIMEE